MKYPEDYINKIIQGGCLEIMKGMPDKCLDLVITSPPYDSLRDYQGYSFNFEGIAKELFRIVKYGGVVVWVVGDATVDGSETGTSFKQALYFKEIGFKLWDTMIYQKQVPFPANVRYNQNFEYMFVLSKGNAKTFNPVVKVKKSPTEIQKKINSISTTNRSKNGETVRLDSKAEKRILESRKNEMKISGAIWFIDCGYQKSTKDLVAFEHPAIFPEKLAEQHIVSWSNKGDLVLDPMNGSGTTTKMAKLLGRKYIGIDISSKYCKIAEDRLRQEILL